MTSAIRQGRLNANRRYQEEISIEFDENMSSRNEELHRQQDSINELPNI